MGIYRERKAQIGIEAALMKLVKQDSGYALKAWVIQDHAAKHALCDHLNAGLGADLGLKPDPKADGFAHRFAKTGRHARGSGPGGQAPRL